MRKVYIAYRLNDIGALRLTIRSWELQGWSVRLLLPDMPKPKSGLVIQPREINYSFKRGRKRVVAYGKRGWKKAPIVRFPETLSEFQLLNCERHL